MKRLLSVIIAAVMVISALTVPAVYADDSAADNILVITDEGRELAKVEVGNEFIFRVGVNAGSYPIYNGQGTVDYDSDFVELVPYGIKNSRGKIDKDYYSFALKIYNSSLLTTYDIEDHIYYNFTKGNAIDVFDDVSKDYFKVRFRAIAPGTTEIHHTMETLTSIVDNKYVRLYFRSKANEQLDPIPYTQSSAEPAVALIGDINGDYDVTILDATYMQRLMAGIPGDYRFENADANADGDVDLRDARCVMRYKAGFDDGFGVGEWIFESERTAES